MSETRPPAGRERGALKVLLRNERALVLAGGLVLGGLAWAYLLGEARGMSEMAGMSDRGAMEGAWALQHLGYLFVMWAVMMVAMMLPSAAPTILLFARMDANRRRSSFPGRLSSPGREGPAEPRAVLAAGGTTAVFVLGYLLVWTAYSATAAGSQWVLHQALLVSPTMVSVSPALSGGLLIAAGAFQFTPLKNFCVRNCRSPLYFLTSHWKEGRRGALEMGLRRGTFCVGCCWALMALLFVLGVMNLLRVTVLALFVLLEKTLPGAERITRPAGAALILWGS